MPDDTEFLNALRSGDQSAWTEAFRELWPVALGGASYGSPLLTPSDIEDAAAEALEDIVGQVHYVGSREELRMLTAVIAYRRAVSEAREKSALKRGFGVLRDMDRNQDGTDPTANAAAEGPSPLRELETAELANLLHAYLERLNPKVRQLLIEKIVLGLTYAEMGRRHGKPIGSMCSEVARGLVKVRQLIDGSCADTKEFQEYLR